jgi:hypothetical protein
MHIDGRIARAAVAGGLLGFVLCSGLVPWPFVPGAPEPPILVGMLLFLISFPTFAVGVVCLLSMGGGTFEPRPVWTAPRSSVDPRAVLRWVPVWMRWAAPLAVVLLLGDRYGLVREQRKR